MFYGLYGYYSTPWYMYDDMQWILWLGLIAIVFFYFWINYALAEKYQSIARKKGHTENYWNWCFWLGIVGWLLVIALPDRGAQMVNVQNLPAASAAPAAQDKTTTQNDELPSL